MRSEGIAQEVRERLDIVEIISEYIPLKKSGQNYKAVCPFHSEKTPSMVVSPHKQIFHCFGCGAGGNVISFVMKYENISFQDALKQLAKKAGIELKATGSRQSTEKDALCEIQKDALDFFAEHLKESKQAMEYLQNRGLDNETIDAFNLGYAPKGWHNIFEHLKKKGFAETQILKSGLVSGGTKGPYDNFRDRVIFPIFNIHGNAIAFGGRVMDDTQPKYLNSPDTLLFKKGDNLYAMNMAMAEIRKKGYAIIVEGYLDAIVCHKHGFINAVAPLGTSLTPGHLKLIGRFAPNVLLVFDGDAAGVSAARRSLSLIIEQGMRAKVMLMPQAEDPDSFLRTHGEGRFRHLIGGAVSFVEFLLKTSKTGKSETVNDALDIITKVGDPIFKEELILELADRSRMGEKAIREKLKRMSKKNMHEKTAGNSFDYNEESLIVSIMLSCPDKKEAIIAGVGAEDFRSESLKKIFENASKAGDVDSLLSVTQDEEESSIIRRLLIEPGFEPADADKNIQDCLKKILKRKLDEQIALLSFGGDVRRLKDLLAERKKFLGGTDERRV